MNAAHARARTFSWERHVDVLEASILAVATATEKSVLRMVVQEAV
jgi:hypothetical protein